MAEDPEVVFMPIPEPGSDAMAQLLGSSLDSMFDQLRDHFPFHCGDVMTACLYALIDAGLVGASPEQLRKDVIDAIDRILADRVEGKGKLN